MSLDLNPFLQQDFKQSENVLEFIVLFSIVILNCFAFSFSNLNSDQRFLLKQQCTIKFSKDKIMMHPQIPYIEIHTYSQPTINNIVCKSHIRNESNRTNERPDLARGPHIGHS